MNNFASSSSAPSTSSTPSIVPSTVGSEIERYLRLPQIPVIDSSGKDQDILDWWRHEAPDFPHLSKMARQFLSAPASSASVERLFSSAGKMHDDLKKNTSEETLESQLIVGLNLPDE
jgi:hypothetical protein